MIVIRPGQREQLGNQEDMLGHVRVGRDYRFNLAALGLGCIVMFEAAARSRQAMMGKSALSRVWGAQKYWKMVWGSDRSCSANAATRWDFPSPASAET